MVRGKSKCDECGKIDLRIRDTVKLHGKRLCRECYRETRLAFREISESMRCSGRYADRKFSRKNWRNSWWEEKKILFGLLVGNGVNKEKAKMRINNLSSYEKNLFIKMKRETEDKEELNKKFKENFMMIKNEK